MIKETTILLADDHAMLRKGLRLLIEQEEGFHIIGEAGDGREAIDQVRLLTPDVVVMDINMPDVNGIEATRQILAESPETRILALSIHAGKTYVEEMLAGWRERLPAQRKCPGRTDCRDPCSPGG